MTGSPFSSIDVQLNSAVSPHFRDGITDRLREDSSTQAGMEDHTRSVDGGR